MTKKRKTEDIVAPVAENIIQQQKPSLVFISHDTRDAEIAEAFSNLLSSVSAGVLKSFRSSDRKGTQGIEYGVEWFPEIMKKLDEASDIVCLLTHNSVDRPWILYEAGVAKGKLSTAVLGIALGIPLNDANNGPFAQFQNCSGDEDSLTKLVLQLVRKIPNADPSEEIVKGQVQQFQKTLDVLLKKQPKIKDKTKELKEDTSIAKLFEEVKLMFQDLPSRIDSKLEREPTGRRKRKFHHMMLDELMHVSRKSSDVNLTFLILVSFFKESLPWMYEIGIETYRALQTAKNKMERKKALDNFERAFEFSRHPLLREFSGDVDDMYILHDNLKHIMHRLFDSSFNES